MLQIWHKRAKSALKVALRTAPGLTIFSSVLPPGTAKSKNHQKTASAERGDTEMTGNSQELYTFRGASPEQVADLCDLWQGSVVESSPHRGIVCVKSDRVSIDQFLMFYELYEYLENCKPVEAQLEDPESAH